MGAPLLTYEAKSARTEFKAILFAGFLVATLIFTLSLGFLSSGPMILGTEMNADGTVEYLCLGNGCESFTDFDW